jgi:hypothetical protein
MSDLDTVVRDEVARETAATVTPSFAVLAIRARRHRVRRIALGAVAVAAGVAVVAVVVPFDGGGTAPAAQKPFDRLADDPDGQRQVRDCLSRGGFSLGGMPLPGLPGAPTVVAVQGGFDFASLYRGCLAAAGYRPPAGLANVGPCDDLLGTSPRTGYEIAHGALGGSPAWRVFAEIRENGIFCAWHTYGSSEVRGVVDDPLSAAPKKPRLVPLEGSAYTLVYGFADRDVTRVGVEVRGTVVQQATVRRPAPNRPMLAAYAMTVDLSADSGEVWLVAYDADGHVVQRVRAG